MSEKEEKTSVWVELVLELNAIELYLSWRDAFEPGIGVPWIALNEESRAKWEKLARKIEELTEVVEA